MSYNMEFVDDLKELIDILEYESTNADKTLFNSAKKILNKLVDSDISDNKATVYELFSKDDTSFGRDALTLEQQKTLLANLESKCKIFNTISLKSREKHLSYITENESEKFVKSIRMQAVDDALKHEQFFLDDGYCTRDWSLEQIKEIFKFNKDGSLSVNPRKPKSYDELGNIEYTVSRVKKDGTYKIVVTEYSIDGHHMNNVKQNPELADEWKNIQFLSRSSEHIEAHAGNFKNDTICFYDGQNYVGVEYVGPTVVDGKHNEDFFRCTGKAYRFDDSPEVNQFVLFI